MSSKVTVGSLPEEAKSKGSLNESTPAEQRRIDSGVKVGPGPSKDANGAYLPAAYKTRKGLTRVDR
jgi:hypothetical protein